MLSDIEELSYKYYEPKIKIIMITDYTQYHTLYPVFKHFSLKSMHLVKQYIDNIFNSAQQRLGQVFRGYTGNYYHTGIIRKIEDERVTYFNEIKTENTITKNRVTLEFVYLD